MAQQQIDPPIEIGDGAVQAALIADDQFGFEAHGWVHGAMLPRERALPLIDKLSRIIDSINAAAHTRAVLNVHHLELFYYVAKAGGITAAVRVIPYGIQQPAVSSQLSRLEESVGTRLFQRRPFSLTPAGRELFDHIAPFFGNLGRLAGKLQSDAAEHLRLAASANVLREHLPSLLKAIERQTPGLRVTLREAAQANAERMLREHEIDLAVVLLETKPGAGIRHEPLLKLPLVLLVEAASRWRSAADLLRSTKSEAPPLIALAPRELLSAVFQKELQRRGLAWPVRIETSGLDLIEAYVGHGFGVGLSLDAPGRTLPPGLRALPLRGFPKLTFGALWSGRLPAPAAAFLELARLRAKELERGTAARPPRQRDPQ